MNRYGKRCVLYPRVSTEMQVDGYSLEGQKNMLTRFADREEMIVVDTYEDAGKSGKSIEGRPAFQKMLRDIEDGLDIDYILVYKLSRFGRNAADILNSLELVQSYGVNLICIEEGIDSSQTSGKLLISVLSAVAEIERENIIEQTMNGRREKARQGGWNGGFAPYGYTLEDNKLMIEETEAVAIRKIFELYTSSEIGLGGIANQLNLQGIRKIPRQNGTLEDWTGHFIKLILDNPVYCGKIAYGRRTKEKVKGTKNDYQMKRNDDYILTEGQHKGIVSEEVWEKAHAKRLRTGVKQPSKIGRDRVHLLSGLLKCPVCGSPMYTNKHAWTNKDGTYKEIYYYVCSRNRMVRGKHCEYKAMLKKTDIEPMVIEAIREIVRNEEYAQAIKKRIGVQIDTKAVDKELEGYQAKLKEVDLNKTRLEREIDSLPADAKYRERKLHDMTLRLDSLYDVIVELEEKIEDARLRRDAIKQQAITLENIYKIMVNFDCVYNIINDEEKRNVVTALIKEIEIYRNDESEYPLKRIGLNFPVFKDGGEVTELLWDKGNTVESVRVLQRELNRIGDNYPAIPRIPQISVYYDLPTENAVRAFQKIFNLTPDGVVGKATWYKIKLIYSGIKQLNELMSEGITPEEAERFYPPELKEGDSGTAVEQMQNLLTIIAYFDNSIPLPAMNGVFDARTKNSLMAFQTQYGLEPTGVLNRQSANMLLSVYRDTRAMATENGKSVSRLIYPGRAILRGRTGADVEDLQSLINRAAAQNAFIPQVAEDGIFGEATENAVKAVQAHEGLDVNGIVGPLTWQALLRLSGLSP